MVKRAANDVSDLLADEVLRYLLNHERSNDTVEGIVAWWLTIQHIEYSINNVEAALEDLVTRELLSAKKTSDGRIHYRLNPKKKTAIRRHLKMQTTNSAIKGRNSLAWPLNS